MLLLIDNTRKLLNYVCHPTLTSSIVMPKKLSPRQRLALERLENGLKSGDISPASQPADVYNSDPIIKAGYANKNSFRGVFNRARKRVLPNWTASQPGMISEYRIPISTRTLNVY